MSFIKNQNILEGKGRKTLRKIPSVILNLKIIVVKNDFNYKINQPHKKHIRAPYLLIYFNKFECR